MRGEGATDSVDTMVDSLQQIAAENDKLIKDFQDKFDKRFTQTYFSVDPVRDKRNGVSIALRAKQNKVTQTYKEFLDSWVVPETGEKLIDPDTGSLFGTSIDLTCKSFADLVRLNEQHKTFGLKYVNLLREKLAVEYGIKFEANLKVIRSHLSSLWSLLFERKEVTLREVESQLEDINGRIRELFGRIPLLSKSLEIKSSILTEDTKEKLHIMLPFKNSPLVATLIHDSTRGMNAASFDNAVRGKRDILVIIKANNNYVFGAFVRDTYDGSGSGVVGSDETFVFSFGTGNRNIKLLPAPGHQTLIKGCGLHVGNNDLVAFCSHSTHRQSFTVTPPGFEQIGSGYISGARSYAPTLMEVFEVKER